jgi:hypothetical protein
MLATPPRLFDMNDVDELYDEAAATFITNATKHSTPFFWYFASHHTHVPQFSGINRNGYTLRGTVRVFRQNFTLEDAIGSRACSLQANVRVTNSIPLGNPLLLPLPP